MKETKRNKTRTRKEYIYEETYEPSKPRNPLLVPVA